jgi:hydrogenase maturation protease
LDRKKTLVLGLGNDILTDDGIGPQLVGDLAGMFTASDIVFDIASCGGLEIMEYIKGYKKVIFIDAIRTAEGRPGDVYYFDPSGFRETAHLSNLHDISFLTALRMGKMLEIDIPAELHIIAVEIIDDQTFNKGFTPKVAELYPTILNEVSGLIKQKLL